MTPSGLSTWSSMYVSYSTPEIFCTSKPAVPYAKLLYSHFVSGGRTDDSEAVIASSVFGNFRLQIGCVSAPFLSPDQWDKMWVKVTGLSGWSCTWLSPRYLLIGSSSRILPCSTSCITAVAVTDLNDEPVL